LVALKFVPIVVPVLAAMILTIAVSILILAKNPKGKINRLCFVMMVIIAEWILGDVILFAAADHGTALLGQKLLWMGACLIPWMAPYFIGTFTRLVPKNRLWLFHLLLLPSFVLYPSLIGEGVVESALYWNIEHGMWFNLYSAVLGAALIMAVALMTRKYLSAETKVEKDRMKFIFLGIVIAAVFSTLFDIVFPLVLPGIPTIGTVFVVGMALCFAYAVVKYKVFDIEAVTEAASGSDEDGEEAPPVVATKLVSGNTYIIREEGTHWSYEMFRRQVVDTPGLCLTTFHPPKLRQEYKLERTPIIWLTETATVEKALNPFRMEFELVYTVGQFMKDNPKTVVLIDDLKYLAMTNGFDKTQGFLKTLSDIAAMNGSILLLPISPGLFTEQEVSALESLSDESLDVIGKLKPLDRLALSPGYSYMVTGDRPDAAYGVLKRLMGTTAAMGLSKTFPDKVRARYELGDMPMRWMTNVVSDDGLSPSRMQFELAECLFAFADENPHGAVLLDGLDQLLAENGFQQVCDFLKSLVDRYSVREGVLLVPINQSVVRPEEFEVLRSRFDVILEDEVVKGLLESGAVGVDRMRLQSSKMI